MHYQGVTCLPLSFSFHLPPTNFAEEVPLLLILFLKQLRLDSAERVEKDSRQAPLAALIYPRFLCSQLHNAATRSRRRSISHCSGSPSSKSVFCFALLSWETTWGETG